MHMMHSRISYAVLMATTADLSKAPGWFNNGSAKPEQRRVAPLHTRQPGEFSSRGARVPAAAAGRYRLAAGVAVFRALLVAERNRDALSPVARASGADCEDVADERRSVRLHSGNSGGPVLAGEGELKG